MVTFFAPTWQVVHKGLVDIATKIKIERERFDTIVGVARGGWVPARILSDLLGVRRMVSLQLSTYTGTEKGDVQLLDAFLLSENIGRVLLVDDVSDTGSSLVYAKELLQKQGIKCKSSTVYVKPWTKLWPDYYFKVVSEWVVFPWEIVEIISPRLRQGSESLNRISKEIGLDPLFVQSLKSVVADDRCD